MPLIRAASSRGSTGFHDEVVGSELQSHDALDRVRIAGEDKHRHVPLLSQAPQH
jgi:hypothetical protein